MTRKETIGISGLTIPGVDGVDCFGHPVRAIPGCRSSRRGGSPDAAGAGAGAGAIEGHVLHHSSPITIATARVPDDIHIVRSLFREYIASLGVDLSFQDIDAELANLPGQYALPAGNILIARDEAGEPVGCCALRPLAEPGACELKRLYVRPRARGQDLGRRLAVAIIDHATRARHRRVLLDTLAPMHAAQQLYASLGFRPVPPYNANPLPGALHMGRELQC